MSVTSSFANAMLGLYFTNTNHANIGDATGLVASTADGDFYISLHTASPGVGGDQTTSEAAYTGYSRVSVSRATGFTVVDDTSFNAANITFGNPTAGSEILTHVGIGTDSSGAGNLLWFETMDFELIIEAGSSPPEFPAGQLRIKWNN